MLWRIFWWTIVFYIVCKNVEYMKNYYSHLTMRFQALLYLCLFMNDDSTLIKIPLRYWRRSLYPLTCFFEYNILLTAHFERWWCIPRISLFLLNSQIDTCGWFKEWFFNKGWICAMIWIAGSSDALFGTIFIWTLWRIPLAWCHLVAAVLWFG